MVESISAISVSRTVRSWLDKEKVTGKVLASYGRAANLLIGPEGRRPCGQIVTLAAKGIGNGPQNIVLDRQSFSGLDFQPEQPVNGSGEQLVVGSTEIHLEGAATWNPHPNWDYLRSKRDMLARLPEIPNLVQSIPQGSLFGLVCDSSGKRTAPAAVETQNQPVWKAFRGTAKRGIELIEQGWESSLDELEKGAATLAGLGTGLTPAGDDFLVGLMLYTWLAHPTPGPVCRAIFEAAANRTTMLSRSFLSSASAGDCAEPWHDLFQALDSGSDVSLGSAVNRIASTGGTSGGDALAGFLWMGLKTFGVK